MNYKLKLCFALSVCVLLSSETNGTTVVWPAIGLASWSDGAHVYYDIGSPVSVYGGDGWYYWIVSEVLDVNSFGATLQAVDGTVGNGHIWFETQYGASINDAAVAGGNFFVNMDTLEFSSLEMILNQVFYLGVRLEYDPLVGTYAYGWAALLWNGTELTLDGSAAETTGVGIYAGTYEAIPEPSVAALLLAGGAALLLRRKEARRGVPETRP